MFQLLGWCARLYTNSNYGGQIQEVPDTVDDHFSISCGVSSVQVASDCVAFLISPGSEAIQIDNNNPFFNDLNQVSDVQCSCCKYASL